MSPLYTFVVLFLNIHLVTMYLTNDTEKLLNWCLNSTSHKPQPEKEHSIYGQCTPWNDKACCDAETTVNIHHTNMYNFTLNHCAEATGKNMSEGCRKHFNQDNCFYECEPHLGFWVVKTKRKIASERFQKVPLCAKDCDAWFDACRKDFTCAYNWPKDFRFSSGVNYCREDATCKRFEEMYKTAKDFCENVWDHSWVYASDDKPCMKMWFDGSKGNPNEEVAKYYIKLEFGGSNRQSDISSLLLFFVTLYFLLNLIQIN